jgi:hypothetical protein
MILLSWTAPFDFSGSGAPGGGGGGKGLFGSDVGLAGLTGLACSRTLRFVCCESQ